MIIRKEILLSAVCAAVIAGCGKAPAPEKVQLKTKVDSFSYLLGLDMANQMKRQGLEKLDPNKMISRDAMMKGFYDAMTKDSGYALSQEAMRKVSESYFEQMSAEMGKTLKAESDKVLAENGKKSGVTSLKNGMQYAFVVKGSGPVATLTDTVLLHLKAFGTDGKILRDSHKGEPVKIRLGDIPNAPLKDAIQLMPVGSTMKVWIPASANAAAANSPYPQEKYGLEIFEVELLSVKS